jgi:hypothetical protein
MKVDGLRLLRCYDTSLANSRPVLRPTFAGSLRSRELNENTGPASPLELAGGSVFKQWLQKVVLFVPGYEAG